MATDFNIPGCSCMKHDAKWQSRVQFLLNKVRDSLIPKQHVRRFNNLLCTCVSQQRTKTVKGSSKVINRKK